MTRTPHTFSECLAKVLHEKQWTVPALANALNVERSLVYKWQRGERTPHLASGYVTQIAELLQLGSDELAVLEEGQVESLRAPRTSRASRTSPASRMPGQGDVQQLLNLNTALEPPTLEHDSSTKASEELPRLRSTVVRGRVEAFQAALDIIEKIPAPTNPSDQAASTILITSLEWGGENDPARLDLVERWRAVASRAMARGWNFCHLLRLDKDARRSLSMARLVLELMGSGRYCAVYFYASELLLSACELAIMPGIAAVQAFATQSVSTVDAAMTVVDPEQIATLQAYFQQTASNAKPLLQTFPPGDWQSLERLRVEAEEQHGARMLVKDGLSHITEPDCWTNPDSFRAKHSGHRGEALSAIIDAHRRRITTFHAQVGRHSYRDICPMRSVVRFAQKGRYLQAVVGSKLATPVEDRIKQLENVIALLQRYSNYELALVDESQEDEIPVLPGRFWEVVGGMRVFTNTHMRDRWGRVVHAGIQIAEPSIVGAFQQYFDTLWGRIAPRDKDKGFVIWWLGRQLESLR